MAETTPKSLLTAKYKKMPWQAQVQNLQRIGARALANVDWMTKLIGNYEMQIADGEYVDEARANIAECVAQRAKSKAKAKAAATEMFAIAKANNDPRVRGL